jgi:hypothetical protein
MVRVYLARLVHVWTTSDVSDADLNHVLRCGLGQLMLNRFSGRSTAARLTLPSKLAYLKHRAKSNDSQITRFSQSQFLALNCSNCVTVVTHP